MEDIPKLTEKDSDSTDETDADSDRPPRDPKNGLYTFLSLLIFAVCYGGYRLIGQNISLIYALHESSPAEQLIQQTITEFGMAEVPSGTKIDYIRLHHNFDNDRLYFSLSVTDDMSDEDIAEELLPFESGDPERESRVMLFPDADTVPVYVYADVYVNNSDPYMSAMFYEEDGTQHLVLCTSRHERGLEKLFGSNKIPIKNEKADTP